MALVSSLITFSPHTTIRSADMNANFNKLNAIPTLPIPFLTFTSDNSIIQSDGNGNLIWNGGIGRTAFNDIYDASSGTTIINQPSTSGVIHLQINGTDAVFFNATGPVFPTGKKLTLTTGSIARMSHFTGTASGTFSHGNGGVPDTFSPVGWNTTTPSQFGWSNATSTQVHINTDTSTSFIVHVVAF